VLVVSGASFGLADTAVAAAPMRKSTSGPVANSPAGRRRRIWSRRGP